MRCDAEIAPSRLRRRKSIDVALVISHVLDIKGRSDRVRGMEAQWRTKT